MSKRKNAFNFDDDEWGEGEKHHYKNQKNRNRQRKKERRIDQALKTLDVDSLMDLDDGEY